MTSSATLLTLVAFLASPGFLAAPHAREAPDGLALPRPGALRNPPSLVNISRLPRTVEVNLRAAETKLSILPGTTTDAYTYEGRLPGPTLEVREGDRVIVHFTNNLPVETTVHWHGLHLPYESDGSPFHPILPGGKRDYIFTPSAGSAGTYWYHPHPDHKTGYQIAKGLYGAIIVRAAADPLPATLTEKVIVLSDNRFDENGAVSMSDTHSMQGVIDRENGRECAVILVNGKVMPAIEIRAGEVQRWRVINASAARVFRLAIPGHTFTQVGTDGGLFEKPVEMKEILIANSERVELLVRGTGKPGDSTVVQALPYDRYVTQTRPADWDKTRDVLTLRYTKQTPARSVLIPATLRRIPALDTTKATVRRTITLSQGLINGRTMDMSRVDVTARLGATEIWEVENIVGMDHPFHLHGFQFQLLDRNGVPEKDRRWKDSINVPKHETARFIVRFDNHPGMWMFHCHILDHEDHGMMGILEVK
ncbi:MAG: multicopper oxidase family protein [Gemmatimonadaceae bacterium]